MVSDTWSRRTALARCWRTSCYGLLYLLCTALVFIMMWLLWCYVGLVALPGSEPQRRAIVHYSATTSKPNLTTLLANITTPTSRPSSKDSRPPQRGSSRGEAPLLKETASHVETSSSTSKGDSGLRDRANKAPLNASADILNKGPSSDTSLKPKRFEDQPSVDEISVRAVASSAPENRDDLTGSVPRDFDKDADKGRRIPDLLPSRDDERPVDRPRYDDDTRSRDYDRGRLPPRDYVDPEIRVRDDISPSRTEERPRRVDTVRPYDDRERPRSDRDRDDYPRRRYDDIDDREYSRPSRRREDDLDYRPPVRRVDDDYDRDRKLPARDDRYRDPVDDRPRDDRRYEDSDRRRPPDYYKDDKIAEDRYRSRTDDRYRDDRDDDYRKDRYRDEDRYRGKPVDDDGYRQGGYRDEDRIRSRDDRYDDRVKPRPVDEVYRPKPEIDAPSRRDDIRPREETRVYRDEIEPRRSRDDSISSSSVYNSRVRDSLERSEDSRTYSRGSVLDPPTVLKSSMVDDRRRDRKDERRPYETDIGYESRSRAPVSSERDRPRTRDDPRYDDRDDDASSRRYASEDGYRRRPVDDDDRYPERRRLDDERPRPVRTDDDDYRGSSPRLSKGDDRGVDRDRPVYIEKDLELSGGVRTRPEDVTLNRRSYSNDDYTRNRPKIDPKYDRDESDSRYRPPPRRSSDPDYRDDDRYEGRPRDRYDSDDYDRKDDRRYSRVDPRDDSYERTRDSIRPSRPVIDERPIRTSLEDSPPRDTYARDPRPAIDDIPARDELPYSRDRDTRRRDYPSSELPRSPQTNIREKRYQEPDEPLRGSSSSRFSKDEPRRALTPKEVIEAAYRQRDEPDRHVEAVYPVFDPRVNNMTSPDIVRPNERRGTTITSRRRKK